MGYVILWLDAEGFVDTAQYFEASDFSAAYRKIQKKLNAKILGQHLCGFLLLTADPAITKRYNPYGRNLIRFYDIESHMYSPPHLLRR